MPWNDDRMLSMAAAEFVNAIEFGCDVSEWEAYNNDPLDTSLPVNCTMWLIWCRIMQYSAPGNVIKFYTKNEWCDPERLLNTLRQVHACVPWDRIQINDQSVVP